MAPYVIGDNASRRIGIAQKLVFRPIEPHGFLLGDIFVRVGRIFTAFQHIHVRGNKRCVDFSHEEIILFIDFHHGKAEETGADAGELAVKLRLHGIFRHITDAIAVGRWIATVFFEYGVECILNVRKIFFLGGPLASR